MAGQEIGALVERMLAGDRVALARLMTLVETRVPEVPAVMSRLYDRSRAAHRIGITGPPGAGKSTLADRIVGQLRAKGRSVGVVAVDPSSPFTGGAVLGDRIRMQAHFLDPGVFIRSLSTRGAHGGLPRAARDVTRLLAAFGKDDIVIETVGVGQTELDVMQLADTVVVALVPEAGDAVQVMKAGLLEIADVFVVNKADRDGAERMQLELLQMLHLRPPTPWTVPVVLTSATTGKGIDELMTVLAQHRDFLRDDPSRARRERGRHTEELADLVTEELRRRLDRALADDTNGLAALRTDVEEGRVDPYSAALQLMEDDAVLPRLTRRGAPS